MKLSNKIMDNNESKNKKIVEARKQSTTNKFSQDATLKSLRKDLKNYSKISICAQEVYGSIEVPTSLGGINKYGKSQLT